MGQFRAYIFLIGITSTYFLASEVFKNQRFKVENFVLPIFLLPKLKSVAQIEWKKHSYYFFLHLVQK